MVADQTLNKKTTSGLFKTMKIVKNSDLYRYCDYIYYLDSLFINLDYGFSKNK